jgi:hypothetical protein
MFAVGAELAPRGGSFAVGATAEPQATEYVARFILETRFPDIPGPVIELARKSILDGLGLALAGSIAETGPIVRK